MTHLQGSIEICFGSSQLGLAGLCSGGWCKMFHRSKGATTRHAFVLRSLAGVMVCSWRVSCWMLNYALARENFSFSAVFFFFLLPSSFSQFSNSEFWLVFSSLQILVWATVQGSWVTRTHSAHSVAALPTLLRNCSPGRNMAPKLMSGQCELSSL